MTDVSIGSIEERLVGHAGAETGRAASGRRQSPFVAWFEVEREEAGVLAPTLVAPARRAFFHVDRPIAVEDLEHPVIGGAVGLNRDRESAAA